jgi:hypothetical protein
MIRRGEDLIEAEEKLGEWCTMTYPELSGIFTEGKINFPRVPTDDDITEELTMMGQGPVRMPAPEGAVEGELGELVHVVPQEVRDMLKREKVKLVTQTWKKIEENLPAVFTKIWSKCSPALQEKMKMDVRYPRIRELKAAPSLWALVKEVASTGVYTDPITRIQDIRDKYTNFCMEPNEGLERYKKRFEQMESLIESAGLMYGEEELAHAFITKLDARFDVLKEVLANTGLHVGALYRGERPKTIEAAYATAQNALVQGISVMVKGRNTAATSDYHGAMFAGQGARGGGGRGGGRSGGGGRGAATAADGGGRSGGGGGRGAATAADGAGKEEQKDKKPTAAATPSEIVCRNCGGVGHIAKDCPSTGRWNIDCYNCGGKGHMSYDCPSEQKKAGTHIGIVCSLAMKGEIDMSLGANDIALDNCTDVSIFCNRRLLTDVTQGPRWEITGHKANVSIYTNLSGNFGLMNVVYAKDAAANVLCQSDIAELYPLYEVEKGIRVLTEQGPLDFAKKGKRFVLDSFNPVLWDHDEFKRMWDNRPYKDYDAISLRRDQHQANGPLQRDVLAEAYVGRSRNPRTVGQNVIETVQGNEAMYTAQERQAAKEAADFIRRSGYQSPANLVEMAKAGGFSGNVPTAHDFQRAIEIYGKPLAYFKGKCTIIRSLQ